MPDIHSASDVLDAPQTFEQEWFFCRHLMYPAETFPLWVAYDIEGPLDTAAFGQAVDDLVVRHDAMRATFFRGQDGQPRQRIARRLEPRIHYQRVTCNSRTQFESYVRATARRDSATPWDVDLQPPYRLHLLQYSAGSHVFLATVHHMAFDLTALEIIERELWHCYARHATGTDAAPLAPAVDLIPVVSQQRDRYNHRAGSANSEYWRQRTALAPPVWQRAAAAGVARPRQPARVSVPVEYGKDLMGRLRSACQQIGCSTFELALCVFSWMAFRLSLQDRLAVHVVFDSRGAREANLMGMFSGVHPIVLSRPEGPPRAFLSQVRKEVMRALVHRHLGGDEAVATIMRQWSRWQTRPQRALSFNYLRFDRGNPSDSLPGGLKVSRRSRRWFEIGTGADTLHLIIREYESELQAFFEFNPSSFPPALAEEFIGAYGDMLSAIADAGEVVLAGLGDHAAAQAGPGAASATLTPLRDKAGVVCLHVDCAEVSAMLEQHPDVLAAEVKVGQHPDGGSEVVAYLRTRTAISDDEVREFCEKWPARSSFAITPGRIGRLPADGDAAEDGTAAAGPAADGAGAQQPPEAASALLTLMTQLLPGAGPAAEFWAAGGSFEVIWELARRAAAAGLPEPDAADFAAPRTLASAAAAIASKVSV